MGGSLPPASFPEALLPLALGPASSAALLVLAIAFVAYQVWRGWKMGLIRAGLRLVGLVGAGLAGWYGGKLFGDLAGAILPVSQVFVWALTGTILALAVYVAAVLASALVFKKTTDNGSPILRWIYGIGGAACGFLVGLVFVYAAVSGVRALGRIAEARGEAPGAVSGISLGLADAKDSLEGGMAGDLVRKADPIPDSLYDLFGKVARLSGDEEALLRLLDYPDFQRLLEHPRMVALASNPSVQQAAREKNYFALFSNPQFLEAATDPDLAKLLTSIDLQKALDYALEKPSTPEKKNRR